MPDSSPGYCFDALLCRDVATTPWGWRDATVREVDGLRVTAAYARGGGLVTLWHHRELGLEPGEHVRVHEEHHALEVDDAVMNVRIEAGMGPVPFPAHPDDWASLVDGILVNHATGDAIRVPQAALGKLHPVRLKSV